MKLLPGVVFILIGIAAAAVAIALGLKKLDFIQHSAVAEGRVLRLNAGGSHPEIEFTSDHGNKVKYPQGGFVFRYRPGDHVQVRYDPERPLQSACVDAFGALWFPPLIVLAIGLACIVGGVAAVKSGP